MGDKEKQAMIHHCRMGHDEVFSCFQNFHALVKNQFQVQVKVLRTDNGTDVSFWDIRLVSRGINVGVPLKNAELDHLHPVHDGQEGEKDVSHTHGDPVDINTDNDVQAQVQPIVGTIPVSTITDDDVRAHVEPTVDTLKIGALQVPVRDRWQTNTLVYSRRQPQVQGEQQGREARVQGEQQGREARVQGEQQGSEARVQGEQQGSEASSSDTVELPIALRKPTREAARKGEVARKALPKDDACDDLDIGNFVSYKALSPSYKAFVASLQTVSIPRDWKAAKQDPKWRESMIEELEALKKNKTWVLTTLPAGKKAVSCKWIFTVKQNPEGKVERYKARLVARGYSQTLTMMRHLLQLQR
ncbi:uncharacterized protein [Triticum aestivum]|uniref:uncharacterized protein n=1 Tax=Triticum aestivum TaxID=4565 RepID=UPI001D01FA61|nr:uncharacterized protein LOC123039386 [Triticum aestivum]